MENKCILVSGNVPGSKNSFVFVREAIKGNKDVQPIELISYEEEIVETETVESTASEEVVENNAVAEETVVEAENDTENKEVSL